MDGTIYGWLNTPILNNVQDITTLEYPGTGFFVYSMTIDNQTYEGNERTGWQYHILRGGRVVDLSEVVGADSFRLREGDIIEWFFGPYDTPAPVPAQP
jgi:hypothetical protein